jgi:ATP adenylyltransferase
MALERLAAAWRESYIQEATERERSGDDGECVFCRLAALEVGPESGVLYATERCYVCLNAFPYGSGHVLVLPRGHLSTLGDLDEETATEFFAVLRLAVRAVEAAYRPDGMNVGMNLGRAAGAGIPAHLHAHVLPRWVGDSNFMTSIAETRVLPESLPTTWEKVSSAWPRVGL